MYVRIFEPYVRFKQNNTGTMEGQQRDADAGPSSPVLVGEDAFAASYETISASMASWTVDGGGAQEHPTEQLCNHVFALGVRPPDAITGITAEALDELAAHPAQKRYCTIARSCKSSPLTAHAKASRCWERRSPTGTRHSSGSRRYFDFEPCWGSASTPVLTTSSSSVTDATNIVACGVKAGMVQQLVWRNGWCSVTAGIV